MRTARLSLVLLALAPAGCLREPPPSYPAAERLVGLMADRLALMDDVARAKWNAKAPATDPQREREFLREITATGRMNHALDPAVTAPFFAAQIEAAKLVQEDDFTRWRASGQAPFKDAPDLVRDVRPRVDRVSRDLLLALSAYRNGEPAPAYELRWIAERRLVGPNVTPAVRAAAMKPLLD